MIINRFTRVSGKNRKQRGWKKGKNKELKEQHLSKNLKGLVDNTIKALVQSNLKVSLIETLSKCSTSFVFYNSGYPLLSRKHFDLGLPVSLPETLPVLNQFVLYQNLTFLSNKLEIEANTEYFIQKCVDLLHFQDPLTRVQFLTSIIFMKLSEKKYDSACLYCEMCLKDTLMLEPGDILTIQVQLFYISCLKGMEQIDSALSEIQKCVELLVKFPEYRKGSYIKLVFLNLTDVYLNLEEPENAIQALLEGGKMLEATKDKRELLDYYKDGWELVDEVEDVSQIKAKMEEANEELYGNSNQAVDLYYLLAKSNSVQRDYIETIRIRQKILNLHKMNNKVNLYFDSYSILASLYLKTDPKSAESYIRVCESLVNNNEKYSSDHMVKLMWYKYHKALGNIEKTSQYFQQYLESYPESTLFPSKLIENHFVYGDFTSSINDFTKSLKSYNSALALNETNTLKKLEIKFELFEALGSLYRKKSNYEQSLEYLCQALEYRLTKPEKQIFKLKNINHEVMSTYLSMNEFHLALHYGEENLKIIDSEGEFDTFNSAVTYYNIGFIYEKMLDRPKAKEFYSKAKKIFLQLQELTEAERVNENLKAVS